MIQTCLQYVYQTARPHTGQSSMYSNGFSPFKGAGIVIDSRIFSNLHRCTNILYTYCTVGSAVLITVLIIHMTVYQLLINAHRKFHQLQTRILHICTYVLKILNWIRREFQWEIKKGPRNRNINKRRMWGKREKRKAIDGRNRDN
jgi:hypothetical protein